MTFLECMWCHGRWRTEAAEQYTRHVRTCPESIECPRCHEAPGWRCRYPGGGVMRTGHHSLREHAARTAHAGP